MAAAKKRLLIVWSSQTGRTRQLVEAACAGAAEFADEVDTVTMRALDAGLEALLAADGLIVATPENFGYLSGAVKDFLDRTYYPAEGQVDGLPYLMLVSAGNDGSGAVRALERIATGFRWKRVAEPLIVRGEPDPAAQAAARERGALLAAGIAFGTL
ncbi:MAG: flavodoxin family protein [Nevskia sp.]|jgi:multimeric flavodoxin WrbA|uniref:flavodoxin family protein n=1 Tax=Nevskia sp. TaxID=1929292 RepID=UPI004035743B